MTQSKKAKAAKDKTAKAAKSRAEIAEKEAQTPEIKPIVVAAPTVKKYQYSVAPGKAITSKKGILGPGDEVKPEYFADGQNVINTRVRTGHITKA